MKNLFCPVSNRFLAVFAFAAALWAAPLAHAGLNVPYLPDADTLHLWHFNDPLTNYTEADAITNAPITLTNFGYPTSGPPFTNIFLVSNTVAPSVTEVLQILPDDGLAAPGSSHAMAAGAVDLAATNFYNQSSGAFTFEALVFPQGNIFSSSAGSGEWEIFCGDNSVGTRGWQFRLQNAAIPSIDFNFISATGGNSVNLAYPLPLSGPDALATNQWYHVAVTYTGNTPTNSDPANLLSFYWTLLDPNRTNADLLATTNVAGTGTIGGTPSPAVGGSQRTTHGVGNGGSFQGMITEVRNSAVCRSATSFAFSSNSVGATPKFTAEPPASTFIGFGQTLTINALVSGSPTPALQWQQTNSSGGGWINVSGQTSNTLTISNATFAAATQYRLVASNNIQGFAEVANSTVASVSIGAAFSETYNTGTDSNGLVNTALAGATDLHYTLSDSADATLTGPATAVWLMTAFPIAANGGGFANVDGVSQFIGPTWNNGGGGYTSVQGNYVYRTHFLADAVDTTEPATIKGTWWANTTGADVLLNGLSLGISTGITNNGQGSFPFTITNGFIPGLNTLDFVVPCVNPNGSYPESATRVEISSALGQALPAGIPQILTEPAANVTVSDSSVVPGASASFSVVATGRPPLSYQWYDQQAGPVAGATSRTLAFPTPAAGGQGTNFTVVISNASGSVTSTVATLTIVETNLPPVAPTYTYLVYSNNSVTFDMSKILLAAGNPNNQILTITWDAATTNEAYLGLPSLGQPVAGGSTVTFTAPSGYLGYDAFNYYIADTVGGQTTGMILIDVIVPVLPTKVQSSLVGNNFVFHATGGAPGGGFVIVNSTDITTPVSTWTPVASGSFDNTGACSVSIPVSLTNAAQYFALELP